MHLTWLARALPAVVAAVLPLTSAADAFPSRPIELIVGFPPGGPTDIIGRVIAEALSKQVKQPVLVINKGGAGGTTAASSFTRQKPDGHTLMLDVESVHTRAPAIYKSLSYDPLKDFAPIAKMAKQRVLLVVHPGLPVKDVKELISLARERKLNYGGTYSASSHIGGALFNMLNNVDLQMIPYPGGSQPILDLVTGTVQVGFFTESTVAQHVQAGKLRALAVAANERSTAFPDLPTLKEAGAAPMDISPWFGVVAPAGMPQPTLQQLHAALKNVVDDKEFAQKLQAIGAVPIHGSTPASYAQEARAETAYWKKFVVDAKFPLAD